ncbi:hypothetical protein EW146_g5918 [Bondarzewia mesenterica]|uniref:Major facilitator superfamily (MFS) profile domain-containing protein n=1 Tax=Bondarzewia mesenterica TaxID=1095465 RepID=A0A4S4LQ49_9AGAM|nr:hypothetical protein EW146_g5918 [Bondarzewia mesenterica]
MSIEGNQNAPPLYEKAAVDVKLRGLEAATAGNDGDESVLISLEERSLVRKLDRRILPIACLMYLFAYLDRSNLGNARLQGLPEDVLHGDPTGRSFDWVNSAFFFSYILCQVPATILSKFLPPRLWLGCAAIGWGLCSTLMVSFYQPGFNEAGLIVARLGLGVFEAGFGPGIPLYFSLFYTKYEMGLRLAYWFGFAAVAGAFGGLIAFGVQHANTAIENWRLLFIIEGIPATLLGFVALALLPNRPEMTNFFNEEERALAVKRANQDMTADVGYTVNKSHITSAFKDWRIFLGGVIYFGANCALASTSAFLPTIIQTFGYTNARAQLMTVPPYAVCAVVITLSSWCSDRLQSRGPFIAAASTVGGIGYLLLLTVPSNNHVRYFATFCITSGTYTTIGITIAWYAFNLASETKRATGTPLKGFAVSCALEFLAAICAIFLTIHYRHENVRKDRTYGKNTPDMVVDTTELADRAPGFRYVP